jgi:two-component system invasion response regulator UvrY
MPQHHRILVADSSKYINRSIWQILLPEPEFEIVGFACNTAEAVNLTTTLLPDIILVDLSRPERCGLQTIQALRTVHPDISVITFSPIPSYEYTQAALDAGAAACLTKSDVANVLLQTLRGLIPVRPSLATRLLSFNQE